MPSYEPVSLVSERSTIYSDSKLVDCDIRLILLNSGPDSEPPCCELFKRSLKDDDIASDLFRYQALSYAWSTTGDLRTIIVNGKKTEVNANLDDALRGIRSWNCEYRAPRRHRPATWFGRDMYLWVDALCINQSNALERSRQVSLMPYIYRKAEQVLIWLGNEPARSSRTASTTQGPLKVSNSEMKPLKWDHNYGANAFALLEQLADEVCLHRIGYFHDKEYWLAIMGALDRIMHARWWFRIWVVQETVLARGALVMRGPQTISWDKLSQAAKNFESHRSSCCARHIETSPPAHTKALVDFVRIVYDLEDVRIYQTQIQSITLLPLLWRFRSRGASDDRDKVYALLGLVNTWGFSRGLIADYTLSTIEVYVRTFFKVVEVTRSLEALVGNQDKNRHPELPSWAPDFTMWNGYGDLDRLTKISSYMASGRQRPQVAMIPDSVLSSPGIHIDVVSAVGGIMFDLSVRHGCLFTLDTWWKLVKECLQADTQPYADAMDAYWRTVCGDCLSLCSESLKPKSVQLEQTLGAPHRRAAPGDYDAFVLWKGELENHDRVRFNEQRNEKVVAIESCIRSTTLSRRFFVTKKGFMGIGPSAMNEGDHVCVLIGGPVPFVLRPEAQKSSRHSKANRLWSMIGDCYVHGIMDGEALEFPQSTYLLV